MTNGLGPGASLTAVELRLLTIVHWRGGQALAAESAPLSVTAVEHALIIGTCQRRVALMVGTAPSEQLLARFPADGGIETFHGRDAYAFLLRFACGLESRLAGETEIFGQIKQAWQQFSAGGSELARQLASCMQQLFQDTKEVRAQHLSGMGSASYGSLVRRLLGDGGRNTHSNTHSSGPTLLVGAGQLGQAVAPWLDNAELWIWNRSPDRAVELAALIKARQPERKLRVLESTPAAELQAWREAQDVVVCVPLDAERDALRVAAWQSGAAARAGGQVIHLGTQEVAETQWHQVSHLTSLGVLFGMLREHNEQRRRQIERARRACVEKALLRSLGSSVTLAHGWEDLLAFDCL